MTTAYTSLLGLALPVTGELSGTWGDTVNNSITSLLDSAIAGTTTLSSDADVTLTTTTGSANTAREAILLWTAGGTATRTITAPAQSKIYTVINASSSTQSIVLAGAGPTTGVTIAKGESALCAWNGSDFIKISNTAGPGTFTNLTVTGNTTLGDADTDTITQTASYVTGTQLKSAKTATNTLSLAAYDVDGTAYTNLITLTASNTPTLALTSTGVGTINNMSIGATTASTGAFTTLASNAATTFTAGTASTTTGTGTLVITGGLGVSGRINAANFDGIVGANTAAAGSFTTVGATGVATFSAGTAALPAITTTGDTNTGIWFPAADTIAFTEGGVESMRLDSSGNLGIGNTSPASYNSAADNLVIGTSGSNGMTIVSGSTSSGYIMFADGTTGQQAYEGQITYDHTSNFMAFNTSATERARIDSSGNLGLGVTPSAWTTNQWSVFEGAYGGALAFYKASNVPVTVLTSNAYNDGSWKYKTTDPALQYEMDGNGGTYKWYQAASGTAGNAITFTQAMTLDSSGRLLVGLTSSISGAGQFAIDQAGGGTPSLNLIGTQGVGGGGRAVSMLFTGVTNDTGPVYGSFARISAAKENATQGNVAGYLDFATTPAGGSLTSRLVIDSTGNLLVGTSTANSSHLIKVTNTTKAGIIFTGVNTVADNGTLSADLGGGSILMVSENNVGDGALFFCTYKSATITLISDPNNRYATSVTAGKICVTKSANSSTATITNKLGSTASITFSKVSTSD